MHNGNTRHTNNTAELTALLRAVQDELRADDGAVVEFCVDSTYAQGVALGRWQAKKNRELALALTAAVLEALPQPVIRASTMSTIATRKTPSTASTSSAAKISGMCACGRVPQRF